MPPHSIRLNHQHISISIAALLTFDAILSHHSITMAPKGQGKKRSALHDVVTRDYTIHMHKRVHDTQFKQRAPKAIKEVVKFAQKAMGVKDVRVDPKLNQEVWKLGVRGVPRRLRVRLERKRNDDEDAKEKLYVYATPIVGITNFHGLQTTVVDQE